MKAVLALLVYGVAVCHCRPDGAPKSACDSLMPRHGVQAQRTSSPYAVNVIRNGDKYRVIIESDIGEEFVGFVVQARAANQKSRIINGKFTTNDVTKTVDCSSGRRNTLTQISPSPKRQVTSEWVPTEAVDENVVFRATVLKTYNVFFTEVDSPPVHVRRLRSSESESGERKSANHEEKRYADCFDNKGCFGITSNCIDRRDCGLLLSYTNGYGGINFEMSGRLDPNSYFAFAFSFDTRMGEDAVFHCIRRETGEIVVGESYNPEKYNLLVRQFPRSEYKTSSVNGLATCEIKVKYNIDTNGKQFNLANNSYYLLLAQGPLRDGAIGYHTEKISSSRRVNFTAFDSIDGEGISTAIKIHGCFMVTGWVLCVSVGILLARHFKTAYETKTLCGVKLWFAGHRTLMIVALCFIVIAFIVIFIEKDGWNYETNNPHAVLGCIAVAFGLFQPLMAAFRPSPDHPNRVYFNYAHWGLGNLAQIIAVITIFFAVKLPTSGLKESFYWVMAIFVVVHLIFHFLFQLHNWTAGRKKTNEVKMLEMSSGRSNGDSVPSKNLADNVFRVLLLGVYMIFIVVIMIALYSLIGIA